MEVRGYSKIMGIGAYLPKANMTSEAVMEEINSTRFGVPYNFLTRKVGIKERRIADTDSKPSDMATMAAREAIDNAGIDVNDIELIIYCGIDRDWQEPATAHRVQYLLGAKKGICFDVTNACHGFVNGLSIANAFIGDGSVETALICTGERASDVMFGAMDRIKKTSDKQQFRKWLGALTVGDAGGAMVLKRSENSPGLKAFRFHSDGAHAELCCYRYSHSGLEGQMLMQQINREIIRLHRQMIDKTYRRLGWRPSDMDKVYCHQVGALPHQEMINLAGVSNDKAPITYDLFGNLTSATIPVNMYLNPPSRGDKLLILGTGSGLSICHLGIIF